MEDKSLEAVSHSFLIVLGVYSTTCLIFWLLYKCGFVVEDAQFRPVSPRRLRRRADYIASECLKAPPIVLAGYSLSPKVPHRKTLPAIISPGHNTK